MIKLLLSIILTFTVSIWSFSQVEGTFPPAMTTGDFNEIFTKTNFSVDYITERETSIRSVTGDFNNNGITDFIVTGLQGGAGFLRVYLGQANGDPKMVHFIDNFEIAGNGDITCVKQSDGSYLVAVQGGSQGAWADPFVAKVYQMTVSGETVSLVEKAELDYGAGKGGLLFIDVNSNGHPDIFQYGWRGVLDNTFPVFNAFYINDGMGNFELSTGDFGIPAEANCRFLLGDMNNDEKIDLVVSFRQGGDRMGTYVYLNTGDMGFVEIPVLDMAVPPYLGKVFGGDDAVQSVLADVNNNGRLDIATSFIPQLNPTIFTTEIFINNGNNTFTQITNKQNLAGQPTLWYGGTWSELVAADFTGDGNQDILLGCYNKNPEPNFGFHTYLMIGDGTGKFDCKEVTAFIPAGDRRINFGANYLTGDFNGNGNKSDLLFVGSSMHESFRGIHLYTQVSAPTSTIPAEAGQDVNILVHNSIAKLSNLKTGSLITVYNVLGALIDQFIADDSNMEIYLKSHISIIRIDNKSYKVLNQ